MAVINKIREKSGWAVGAIAIGMLIFMVLGDLLGPNSRLFGRGNTIVGEIAGKEITIQEFEATLDGLKQNYAAQNGKQPGDNELAGLREQAWNQLIFKTAFQQEFDRLGLDVSEEELVDMVQGNHIHPAIQQAFVNPETKQFDRAAVIEYLSKLDKQPAEQQAQWHTFEAGLGPDRMRVKFDNLIKQSAYVTNQEAKNFNDEQNSKANIKYLFVPFFTVSDSALKVTDDQLKAYLDKNKAKYKTEETRKLEYITIPVMPSEADKAAAKEEVDNLVKQFSVSTNDSLFVKANSESPYNGTYVTVGELPENLKTQALTEGAIFGPYTANDAYTIYKVSDVRDNGPASIRASHILFKPTAETPEAKAEAKKKAEDVLTQIKGGADFAAMARQYGSDGTASQGGDLGWFREKSMVPEFDKAVFGAKGTGLQPNVVETQFGYHIVKVTEPKTTRSYKVATVSRSIGASDETREEAYRKAMELANNTNTAEEFTANLAKDKTLVKSEAKVRQNDRYVNTLANARELVRWAFSKDVAVGSVSKEPFEINDQFVVAVVTGKTEKGTSTVDDVREELTAAVRNEEKAKMIAGKLKAGNGTREQIAAKYGPEAQVRTASVTFGSGAIETVGMEPVAVGSIFGLKPGKRSGVIEGQAGLLMAELQNIDKAPAPADLGMLKNQLKMNRTSRLDNAVYEAVKTNADIKDNRVKFF
jgi:peptidyl-prolyl cis-trans isomerase D